MAVGARGLTGGVALSRVLMASGFALGHVTAHRRPTEALPVQMRNHRVNLARRSLVQVTEK